MTTRIMRFYDLSSTTNEMVRFVLIMQVLTGNMEVTVQLGFYSIIEIYSFASYIFKRKFFKKWKRKRKRMRSPFLHVSK